MLSQHFDGKAGRKLLFPDPNGVEVFHAARRKPMPDTLFDILKKDPKGTFHWVEAVRGIDTAEARLRKISADSADEFVVFRNIDLRVVATYSDKQYKRL